ncbi:ADP-ribose pyrophosphatase YjhB (NUDIX family) [Bacillus pakistanensis]|uniref:ADP-ribose pyrophosphatase YjhB (NUDIX family) n=1 Tax=Rossellomorea pakistanensis TaxID=992288 RepID=A0ABS2NCB2_9BACI|nr:NUDIX domain-containing protein [Bacillus pakistanensis]MBM7585498.1 ADP-ribose pyrophosphatase YjhB (NUDIX family) [Bacillus pakistanensis]
MPKVGVFASVIDEEDRILCVKINYGSGNWTLPGGHLEKNESPIDGVKREVYEETGFLVEIDYLISLYSAPEKDDLVLLFKARIIQKAEFVPNGEIEQIAFFDKGDLPKEMHPWNMKRIYDAFNDKVSNLHIFK